ncbi:MAG: hypothetical protein L0206_09795 [Actinobacteria bacterium]|nr:hypothetical protein [Actinomycetota bacterium]
MAVEDEVRREIVVAEERMDLRLQTAVAGVRTEIAAFRGEVRTEIAEFRGEVRTEISEFRGEVRTEFESVRSEITDLRAAVEEKLRDQTWKTVGAFGVLGALTVTLSQLG